MTDPEPTTSLRPEKRAAILQAARTTFATMGFSRATIDTIAAEAGVSTRTIYKHFQGKDDLFAVVLESSARAVADDFEATVRAGVAKSQTVHERLMVCAQARTKQSLGHPEHFAMVEQIVAETQHFPPGVLAAWRKAGPDRVEQVIVDQLHDLCAEGLLEIDDMTLAARHFFALTAGQTSRPGGTATPTPSAERKALRVGVDVFARGYAPR